jgi:hypothetical protein
MNEMNPVKIVSIEWHNMHHSQRTVVASCSMVDGYGDVSVCRSGGDGK